MAKAHTPHQNFLYNRALYGLSTYTPEEVVIMSPEKRKKIIRLHKKTQKILNLWKQEIVNTLANKLFTNIFPEMELTKSLVKFGIEGDPQYTNNMSFKMLKIGKKEIISKLIENKILPKNFNELNQKENASRISSKRESDTSVKPGECSRRRVIEISSKAR